MTVVEEEVERYLNNVQKRNLIHAKETVLSVKNKTKIENRLLRIPEAEFQNNLLKLVYNHNISVEQISSWIKIAFTKHSKDDPVEIKSQTALRVAGIESCINAIKSLESELIPKYGKENILIATNNEIDARYQIDLLVMVRDKNKSIQVLKLVQVMSDEEDKKDKNINETHQQYIDSLPKLMGILNAKESVKLAEKEVDSIIDIDRRSESVEQLTLFGLAFDQYLNNVKDIKNINAVDFFEFFKKEGGLFNPFTIMGILKNPKVIDMYRKNGYFVGDIEKEKYLAKTAEGISYTEAESIAFFHKNHTYTIIDSAEIFSVTMLSGKKVSEEKIQHSFNITK